MKEAGVVRLRQMPLVMIGAMRAMLFFGQESVH